MKFEENTLTNCYTGSEIERYEKIFFDDGQLSGYMLFFKDGYSLDVDSYNITEDEIKLLIKENVYVDITFSLSINIGRMEQNDKELFLKQHDALSEYQENHSQLVNQDAIGDVQPSVSGHEKDFVSADNQEKQKEDSAHQESGICGETPIPGIESDTLQSRTDEPDSLILKKSCKNCHYYEPDFNGKECCTFKIFINPGRVKELPKERICNNFANQKETAEVKE